MRATEHTPAGPCRVLEHRHGLADIGERGAFVLAEHPRASPPHKVDVFSWAIASWEIWTLKGKPYAGLDIDQHMYHAVQQNERPAVPKTWRPELVELQLLGAAWRGDPQQRCSAGHAAGVLTRLEVSGGPDPLAANMACCVIA